MRNAFAQEISRLAAGDPRVVLLSGDIGNRLFDPFKNDFADRFFNCGVAEANMMSVAAGMASSGLRPVVYTIVPFVTTRCLEQIRVDVCYHNVPVVIVGVGGGLSYAGLGATHHSCEDIALLRMLPGMNVVCPGDAVETRLALREALSQSSPTYIRIGKKGEPIVHEHDPDFRIGRAIVVREGADVALVSTGNMLPTALDVAEALDEKNVHARVVSMHTVKPIDEQTLAEVFTQSALVVSIEEHSILGGLGGTIAEWCSDQAEPTAQLLRIGTPDEFFHQGGSQVYARQQLGLDADSIATRVLESFRSAGSKRNNS